MKIKSYSSFWHLPLTLLILIIQASGHSPRATYGEPCSRTNRCDSRAFLTCINGSCGCMRSDVMTFDGTMCVVLAGEKCSFTAVDVQDGIEERSWREELSCVANSDCQDGYCSCHPTFFENSTGLCLPKRDYHGDCEFDQACKNEQGLTCNEERRCDCNSTTSTYDHHVRRCVTKAGQSCMNNQACVLNAGCHYYHSGKRICTCNENFFKNPLGECEAKRGYNEPCESNEYCQEQNEFRKNSRLTCTENKRCECDPITSIYSFSRLCVAKVGQPCRNTQDCIANAECSYYTKVCKCYPNYFLNSVGKCETKRGYNEVGENTDNCQDGNGYPVFSCNENKRCGCHPATSLFDNDRQRCVTIAGQSCLGHASCVSNAMCVYDNSGNQICVCDENHFANPKWECETKRGYNETCLDNHYCQHSNSKFEPQLVCNSDKICDCEHNSTFDQYQGFCVRHAGVDCSDFPRCAGNSDCLKNRCVCAADFFQTEDGMCQGKLGYGEACKADDQCQDHMKCSNDTSLCDCESSSRVYDNSTGFCRGLVDSPCTNDKQCTRNSQCVFGTCLCSNAYSKSKHGTCLVTHNEQCGLGLTETCNEERGLVCNGGICRCKYENFQLFEKEKGKCLSGVLGPCDESTPCIDSAHCLNSNGTLRQCECESGFVAVDEQCLIGIGQPCDYKYNRFNDTNTLRFGSAACDVIAPLKCIQGICQCGPLEEYDYASNKCKGLVGSRCLVYDNLDYCIQNAYCFPIRNFIRRQLESKGICKCKPGMLTTEKRRCVVDPTAVKPNESDEYA